MVFVDNNFIGNYVIVFAHSNTDVVSSRRLSCAIESSVNSLRKKSNGLMG